MRSNGKGFPQFATPRGKRTLKKCSASGEADNFVLIEVDSDHPAVIIVDVPESVQKKLRMPSARNIISIDDDEVSSEECSADNGDASSSGCSSKSVHSSNIADENESGGGTTESDCSDCECIDGRGENVREQWESASKRRKTPRHTDVSDDKQASTSTPQCDHQSDPSGFVAQVFPHHGKSSGHEADAVGTGHPDNVKTTEEKTSHDQESDIAASHDQEDQRAERDYKSNHSAKTEADGSSCEPSNDSDKTRAVLQYPGNEASQNGTVIDRQKIKETDQYKRAMEELQASRQQQLHIQVTEAQRLRRRKRAESTRLMDMERRQKLRLEEMREAQKKDEAKLNMKEQIRVEICKELSQVERSCVDMASLLGKLGLLVSGSQCPSKSEVVAAYKRALLKFHPDRASRSDIRQQVEAEEKFKLISRMKERL